MFEGLSLEQKVDILLHHIVGNSKGAVAGIGDWVAEDVAAKIMGCAPRTLRRKCKDSKLLIKWRANASGRGYEYSLKSINEYKENTGTG